MLYRCIQEGITNAIRHGKAGNLSIALIEELAPRRAGKKAPAKLSLTLGDDGKGIAPSTPRGFGLTSMTERVRSLGGTCEVGAGRSKGTVILIEIPLQRASEKPTRTPALIGGMS